MIIDTHSHIYLKEFDEDRGRVVQSALNEGINTILLPNIDSSTIDSLHQTETAFPNCIAMMGLHPTSVKADYLNELEAIKQHLFSRSYIAVGEIGIDLYWDKTFKSEQMRAFEQQIKWAIQLNLPIVIHCREAFNEVFEVVDRMHCQQLKGIFHSFGDNVDVAKHIMDYGTFKMGINGVVTYKKSNLPEVLMTVDPSFLVVETDAPFLTPVPHRGKRNEPAYVKHVVQKLSDIYSLSLSDMEQILESNTKAIFDV
jgi:TatD DNase family protein